MTKKLLVIDGHSMAFRAFYALPTESFTASGGQHTNAVYGFLSMLAKMLETEHPTHIVVAFDASRESFRTAIYPEYKGTRESTPEEFKGQVEIIGAVLEKLGVKSITAPDFEADDVLATLAKEGPEEGFQVLVASGDRDTFQLVNQEVTVLYPGRTTSDVNYMTPAAVEEKYGVEPQNYPELAAIVGETSDNLPGVPGVGPKTAAQWLAKFGGLENLLARADEVGGKRGEALREHLEDVRRNRRLNALVTDMPLDVTPEQCVVETPDRTGLNDLFDTLEFGNLRNRVYKAMAPLWPGDTEAPNTETANPGEGRALQSNEGESKESPEAKDSKKKIVLALDPADVSVVSAEADLEAVLKELSNKTVALWGEGRLAPTNARLDILAFASEGSTIVVDTADLTEAQYSLLGAFLSSHPRFVVHGGKALAHGLRAQGWSLAEPIFDTQLAAYLCNPNQRDFALDQTSRIYLGEAPEVSNDGGMFSLDSLGAAEELGAGSATPDQTDSAVCALTVFALAPALRVALEERQSMRLLTDIEIPVSGVLFDMECAGVAIDREVLAGLRREYASEVDRAAKDAFDAIGRTVNLGSPKQLQAVLFDELGMPKTRKTRTGYTTDAEALQDLFQKTAHPFLEALLRHRDRAKLVQIIDGLIAEIQTDGRIHSTFSQIASATGRLASSDPNLQNIPARSDSGLRIREAFVAGPGYEELMSVDYSQIEMRIMAHLSRDQDLIAAFKSGADLHKTMASLVFGVPIDEVDSELRNRIKATSYGLVYGLSPFGLSRQLGVSVEEATKLHKDYFARFGQIGRYLREVVEDARHTGYTQTMFGRRRYFPDLNSQVRRVRDMAERAALNAPIQGSAADIFKLAMMKVTAEFLERGLSSRIVLQIHDELLLEVAPGESEEVRRLVIDAMSSAVKLSVPLDVSVGEGKSWRSAAH